MHTFQILNDWYKVVPWEDEKLFDTVNHMHKNAFKRIDAIPQEDYKDQIQRVLDESETFDQEPLDRVLFESIHKVKHEQSDKYSSELYNRYLREDVLFSQLDMSMVQLAFCGTFVAHRRYYGAGSATTQEIKVKVILTSKSIFKRLIPIGFSLFMESDWSHDWVGRKV